MKNFQAVAGALVLIGTLALAYGGVIYSTHTHASSLSPPSFPVENEQKVNIHLWAGAATILAGGFMLLYSQNKLRQGDLLST